jgi:hypothetical protein
VIVEQQVQLFQGPSLGVQPVVTKYARIRSPRS